MSPYLPLIYTIAGLMLFEVVSSIDNAVINAEVLASLPPKNRWWFTHWGLFFAVFGMRGLLPWLIVWLALPSSNFWAPFTQSAYTNPSAIAALHTSAQALLLTAGTALLLIFLYWFLVDHHRKKTTLLRHTIFFFLIASSVLAGVTTVVSSIDMRKSIVVGTIIFLALMIIKQLASLPREHMSVQASRRTKVIYLEVLDSIFSIEAVLGAFAFTFSVPLILIGNGLGAIIVRSVTAIHGQKIRTLLFLKRGAMYSLGLLSVIMLLDGVGTPLPGWLAFLTTLVAMGAAYLRWQEKGGI